MSPIYGPEPWTDRAGAVWSHWDLWFCVMATLEFEGDRELLAEHIHRTQAGALPEEAPHKVIPRDLKVGCHSGEDAAERPDAQRVVAWDCHVMLATLPGRQADVGSRLPRWHVAQPGERLHNRLSGQVAG